MADTSEYYHRPQETWDRAKCEKLVKRRIKDGLGTVRTARGYLYASEISGHYAFDDLKIRYNGGCIRNDKWYQGEISQLPIIPPEFEIVYDTLGWRIIKKLGASTFSEGK